MVGIDVVRVSRISDVINKFGNRFLRRIFTSYEINQSVKYTNQSMVVRHFAKRFAVKEAYTKAVGGMNNNFSFNNLGVKNNEKGKPYLYLDDHQVSNAEISLSDDGDYAVAVVMLK